MKTLDQIRQARIEKLQKLQKMGVNPYPPTVARKQTIAQAQKLMGKPVSIVGRVMGLRGHGKVVFGDVVDESGKIQVVLKADKIPQKKFDLIELVDIGDFLQVDGKVGKTEAGQLSVFATDFNIVSKAIRPLPDQWYGLKDIEERYRKRYLDLLLNPAVKKTIDARWVIEKAIREFLWKENYTEVETPILQPLYGGTNARPFTTHMNALDSDFYLRVAPELYLKRLVVGGYERVFEIARNFRNEGIDLIHQPEFTMMEFYEAYADYMRIMQLTEDLVKYVAKQVNGSYELMVGDKKVDLSGKWHVMTVDEALKKHAGLDWDTATDKEIADILKKHAFTVPGVYTRNKALFVIYDHIVTEQLVQPTWVIDYPIDVSPLSKTHRSKKGRVERFEGYIGGKEVFDGWSEIVSAIEQRERFENEQKNMKAGDEDAQPLDEEFLTTLEYGCPPMGGIGIGIDRVVMLLTNTWVIREVIAFPTLRPTQQVKPKLPKPLIDQGRTLADTKGGNTMVVNRKKAWEILTSNMENKNLIRHCLAVETVMRALARHFGEDEEVWGVVGLLHDGDYEKAKDDPKQHTILMAQWLKQAGETNEELMEAILSHNYAHTGENPPKNNLEWSLYCCDELTGLIVAVTLVRPEKKIADVTYESIMKKWKNESFAAGVHRPQIAECETRLGIPLKDFIDLSLTAMQGIAEEIGL